ncbi:MAG: YqiA/YcfP family alpha/beta fold hydrolase [Lautropia sp.]
MNAARAATPARRLIYLHGFRSSSRSFKARLLADRMADAGLGGRFVAPDLPPSPAAAVALVERVLAPGADDVLVGSSLGGLYATWLGARTGARIVLLNPAVHAARDLAAFVGPQRGYHDDAPFVFEARFIDELRALEAAEPPAMERVLLIAAKGDEVLDWREMVARYPGAHHRLLEGGDHGLSDFAALVDDLLAFAGLAGGDGATRFIQRRGST